MRIELSPEQEAIVYSRLDSGRYATPEDVLSSALNLLESYDSDFTNTHALIEEGHRDIEAGRVHDVDQVFDELFAELDEKLRNATLSVSPEPPTPASAQTPASESQTPGPESSQPADILL